jgi:hypothetical protein
VDVNVAAAGGVEDAGGGKFTIGIVAADPQQRRPGPQCGLEIIAVARRGVVVEQFLQRRSAETGADQRRNRGGDRPARQYDDAGHRQRCEVFDLAAEPGRQKPSGAAIRFAGRGERIMRSQYREVARREPGAEQVRYRRVKMPAIGERSHRLANDRKRRWRLGHADPL